MRKILIPCLIIVACSAANAGGPMYNTPVSNIAKITQIIGTCDKEEFGIEVSTSDGKLVRTPIQCDYGVIIERKDGDLLINFAYGNDAISFGGTPNKANGTIVVDQVWPGPSPVEAVNKATFNGIIEDHLDAKCFHESGYVACGASYQNDEKQIHFFLNLKITYKRLMDITEEFKRQRASGRSQSIDPEDPLSDPRLAHFTVLEGRCTDNSYIDAFSKSGISDTTAGGWLSVGKIRILCGRVWVQDFTNGRRVTSFVHKNTMLSFGGSPDERNTDQAIIDDLYPGKTPWDGINNEEDANGKIDHDVEGKCMSDTKIRLMGCEASFLSGRNRFRFFATINITKRAVLK